MRDSVDATKLLPHDARNPDARLRARLIVGLPTLTGMRVEVALWPIP